MEAEVGEKRQRRKPDLERKRWKELNGLGKDEGVPVSDGLVFALPSLLLLLVLVY